VRRLLAAQVELKGELDAYPDPRHWGREIVASMMPWQPVLDGRTIPSLPIERISAGAARDVDVLVGTNTDDWRLFLAITGELGRITEDILTGPVSRHGFRALAAYGLPNDGGLAAYRSRYPGASPGDILAAVQTDWWVRVPASRLADAHANSGSRTYMYEFAWAAPGLGAVHALEVPFVFDTIGPDVPLFGALLGTSAPQSLADEMHARWVAFASTGDPGWPKYDRERRATICLGTPSAVVDDPRSWERDLWDRVR
jgi:para-nitrobenzyl esterase